MERYANPFAVLPFTPPAFAFPPTMPVTSFQTAPPMSAPPMFAPPMFPPPMSAPPMFAPPMSAPPMFPPPMFCPPAPPMFAPQMFVPPPQQAFPDQATLPPPPNPEPIPPQVPGYDQSACRACPPAPPELSIPVNQYHWTQHCSACHCTPSSSFDSNVRPTRGRITPLLGPPLTPDLTIESSRYPHVNSPHILRPRSSETPPLPEGATILADYYLTRGHFQQNWSPNLPGPVYSEKPKRRRRKAIKERPKERRIYRSNSPRKPMKKQFLATRKLPSIEKSTPSPTWSSRLSLVSTSAGASQGTLVSESSGNNFAGEQVSVVEPQLNVLYKFPQQEYTSVYHKNCYLPSSTQESVTSSSRSRKSMAPSARSPLTNFLSVLNREYHRKQPPPPPLYVHLTREKSSRTVSPVSTRSGNSSFKSIVIRQFTPRPGSVTSSLLSDTELLVVAKDLASTASTTSTLKKEGKKVAVHAALSFKDF